MNPIMPDITVNGVTLSAADIAAEAQNQPAPKGKPGLAWRRAARALAVRQLLLEASADLEAAPQEIAPGKRETPEEARIRALLERDLNPAPASEAELRAAYDANPGAFRAPSLFEAAHILWAAAPDDDPARKAAHLAAAEAKAILDRDPKGFARIAQEQSTCSSKDNGGFLGQMSSGDTVPEFEAAMRDLDEGAISGPVDTRFGVHLIRLDAKSIGDVLPFDSVHARLREAAEKAAWTRAAQAYIAQLITAAKITGIDLKEVA